MHNQLMKRLVKKPILPGTGGFDDQIDDCYGIGCTAYFGYMDDCCALSWKPMTDDLRKAAEALCHHLDSAESAKSNAWLTKKLVAAVRAALAAPAPASEARACAECHGTGRTDNHVTGEVECSACEGSGSALVAMADRILRGDFAPGAGKEAKHE
jgi:hypothetical protein